MSKTYRIKPLRWEHSPDFDKSWAHCGLRLSYFIEVYDTGPRRYLVYAETDQPFIDATWSMNGFTTLDAAKDAAQLHLEDLLPGILSDVMEEVGK